LALPFEQRLFFAGEATHTDDFSTAHGAYDSGVRAAVESIAALARPEAQSDQP
jgi:monoamine oxidase